jgi:hypothetical protein
MSAPAAPGRAQTFEHLPLAGLKTPPVPSVLLWIAVYRDRLTGAETVLGAPTLGELSLRWSAITDTDLDVERAQHVVLVRRGAVEPQERRPPRDELPEAPNEPRHVGSPEAAHGVAGLFRGSHL